jgi:2-polyprenyl-6-methoxyphenol hydroxylase-like FAD-dependent oxidoreductase
LRYNIAWNVCVLTLQARGDFTHGCVCALAGASNVSITLEDGSVETGDLLIGADGIWSKVRRQMIGHSEPCYSGYTCYTGKAIG